MDRRKFCLGMGTLAAVSSLGSLGESTHGQKPNIVFVLADDMGFGDLDVYNHFSAVPTPNADRLAKEGMRFTDMHSSSAVCTPSRYSILTGRYCWRTRLQQGVLNGYSPNLIEPGRMTVASMLQANGYYTAGIGKWHLGLGKQPRTDYSKPLKPGPTDHGFDYYFGIPASLNMKPFLYFEDDHVVEPATGYTKGMHNGLGDRWDAGPIAPDFVFDQVLPTLNARAVSVIRQRSKTPGQPFFLYLSYPSPHNPWLPLPQYKGKSRAGTYGDYVNETDAMLGDVMRALQETGLARNTLLILTSDNGADWKLDNKAAYEHRANGNWRGEKADVWEAGTRIPFIARWPGHIPPDTVSHELGSLTDFMATVAAINGITLPDNAAEDSFDLLPALLGKKLTEPIREFIIDQSVDGMLSIRQGNWILGEGLGSGGFSFPRKVAQAPTGPAGQLYDLATDPRELHNVYREHPKMVKKLLMLLDKYQRQGYSRPMKFNSVF